MPAASPPAASPSSPSDDDALVAALRARDERAFATLVDRHHAALLRVASLYVRDRAAAEEVVQETWLAVIEGIDRFQARSSLKTWLFRILANRAQTRGQREARSVPFSALAARDADGEEPAVDPARFTAAADRHPGRWAAPPRAWETLPEERLLSQETLGRVAEAIEALPGAQRTVVRLRDVEGWSAAEVAEALEISDGNQRVLLHRGRSKVRQALEDYLGDEAAA
ncbi:MAG: RNA polymerase sigma factor [Solirubrobacteraceae bacterium]